MTDSAFQEYYEQATNKLNENLEEFRALADNSSRIKFAFALCEEFQCPDTSDSKHLGSTDRLKTFGNQLFKYQNYNKALAVYNEAITSCPQDNLKGKEAYACLIGNRSAVFLKTGKYEKVLQDVAFLNQYGHHPFPAKISARGIKAREALRKTKILVLEEDGTVKTTPRMELTWRSGNHSYPALSKKLTVKKNKALGRHIVATGDFKTGDIIAIEKPYVAVTTGKSNCDYCAISTDLFYPCAKCRTIYCSTQCMQKAQKYHQYECLYGDSLNPENIRLAWRMITQRTLQQVIDEEVFAGEERQVDIYKSDDYYNISRLVQHEDQQDFDALIYMTLSAVFLLGILRTTGYFGSKTKNHDLSKEEMLVCELLLKYQRIICYNTNVIGEVQNDNEMKDADNPVGIGIYPTLSLFNHSCDSSITKYNINNATVFRSIKPIKTGDVVYGNYGASFLKMPKKERSECLAKYRISCKCQACKEDWPLFADMNREIYRGLCDCGGEIHYPPNFCELNDLTSGRCQKCKRMKDLPELKRLGPMLDKAESRYAASNNEDGWKLFAQLIDAQYQYLAPPFFEVAFTKGRLADCLRQLGNTRFDYQPLYNIFEALAYMHMPNVLNIEKEKKKSQASQ